MKSYKGTLLAGVAALLIATPGIADASSHSVKETKATEYSKHHDGEKRERSYGNRDRSERSYGNRERGERGYGQKSNRERGSYRNKSERMEKAADRAFERFDLDGDGYIDREEFGKMMRYHIRSQMERYRQNREEYHKDEHHRHKDKM